MPGEDRRKITPDKSGKGKHKTEKTSETEKLTPPTGKKKDKT
jgi:hypothetical protein